MLANLEHAAKTVLVWRLAGRDTAVRLGPYEVAVADG